MGKVLLPSSLKQLPTDPMFWDEERQLLLELLFPYMSGALTAGALVAFEELVAMADLGVAWDIINQTATAWASQYTVSVVGQISKTSMAAFLDHFEPWVNSGEPLKSLIDALTPYYGPVRANMIAVTETTRAYHAGNVLTWKTTGMVEAWQYHTAMDEIVMKCPICWPLEGMVFPLDDFVHAPPQHVGCRCWSSPVVNL